MKNTFIAAFLIILGTFKAAADLMGQRELSALGAATNASPAMKVFTAHRGFETHSSRFVLELSWQDGARRSQELTPEVYQRIGGPYNRRNVYGAALAYGPILIASPATKPMFNSVSRFAFCVPGLLLDELALRREHALASAQIRFVARQSKQASAYPTTVEVDCG